MKKIMFNDRYGLTDAVLQGRKTMTRRMVKDGTPLGNWGETEKYAKYKIGEVVAVAQSYYNIYNERQIDGSFVKWCNKNGIDYVEEIHKMDELKKEKGYNNKMFVRADLMPHQIRITDIKVERLQDISYEDCLKEGVFVDVTAPKCYQPFYTFVNSRTKDNCPIGYESPQYAFAALIDKVSGKGTWERNPWVFAYSFELVK